MVEEFCPSSDIEVSANPNEKITVPYTLFVNSIVWIPDGEAPPAGYYPCEVSVSNWEGIKKGIVKDNDPMSGARGRAYCNPNKLKKS